AGLMLQVFAPRTARTKHLAPIRDAVAISIAIKPDLIRAGLVDEQAIGEREQHSGKEKLVNEHAVLVVIAVAPARPMQRDTADTVRLARAVDVEHIAAHLRHKH